VSEFESKSDLFILLIFSYTEVIFQFEFSVILSGKDHIAKINRLKSGAAVF